MICPWCGQKFNLTETRSDYNAFGKEDPTISYDDIPEKLCYSCAQQYVSNLFEKEMNDHGFFFDSEDGGYYKE